MPLPIIKKSAESGMKADFLGMEVRDEEEEVFSRTDRVDPEASKSGASGCRPDPTGRDLGAYVLSLEEAICRLGIRSGARVQAAGGRERAAEEAGGRAQPGQGGASGCAVKKMSPPRAEETGCCLPDDVARLRDECFNLHGFETLAEARQLIEAWRIDYNVSRPHMALGDIPPAEYALQAGNQRGSAVLT